MKGNYLRGRPLSTQDIHDILIGSAVLSGGGGGQLSDLKQVSDVLGKGDCSIRLVSIDDAPSDALTCTAFGMCPLVEGDAVFSAKGDQKSECQVEQPFLKAFRLMEKTAPGVINAIFPVEIGLVNIAVALYIAHRTEGLFVLDADPAGRSVPEIHHLFCRMDGARYPTTQAVAVNHFDENIVMENLSSSRRLERTFRALSLASGGSIGGAIQLYPIGMLRDYLIPGTVSRAREIGCDIRVAAKEKGDVASIVAKKHDGKVVFCGSVNNFSFTDNEGFTVGFVEFQGTNEWDTQKCRMDAKNENMVLRVEGQVKVTIPDIICVFDNKKGEVVLNPSYAIGMAVTIVVLPAAKQMTSAESLDAFGPAYIGIAERFKSICE